MKIAAEKDDIVEWFAEKDQFSGLKQTIS